MLGFGQLAALARWGARCSVSSAFCIPVTAGDPGSRVLTSKALQATAFPQTYLLGACHRPPAFGESQATAD